MLKFDFSRIGNIITERVQQKPEQRSFTLAVLLAVNQIRIGREFNAVSYTHLTLPTILLV